MPVMVLMRWDGVSTHDYDTLRELVRWEENPPSGVLYHVAAQDGTALRVTDIWDSAAHFTQFVETRLMPAVTELGITTEPDIELFVTHALFAPGYSIDLAAHKAAASHITRSRPG